MNIVYECTLFRMHAMCHGRRRVTLSTKDVASRLLNAIAIINSNISAIVRVYRVFRCWLGCPRTSSRGSSLDSSPTTSHGFSLTRPENSDPWVNGSGGSLPYPGRMAQGCWAGNVFLFINNITKMQYIRI